MCSTSVATAALLDAADFVFRYSWMSARDSTGKRGLVEDDGAKGGAVRLSELGQVWNER